VLDTAERPELKDTEVSTIRDGSEPFAGDLTSPETALGASLIRPLVVANSSFSTPATEAEDPGRRGVADVSKQERGETIVRETGSTRSPGRRSMVQAQRGRPRRGAADRLRRAVDPVIAVLPTWTWRFRREFCTATTCCC
jgi:hypothetical protein